MDEKKLEILERASSVYLKFGIKSVTMDDLARELSISKKTIYKYFNDKNDLVKSIIEMKVQMDSAVCSNTALQSDNAIDELIQISQLVIEQFNDFNPSVFFDIQKFHKEAWDIIVHHKATFVQNMIRENIERGVKEKIYRENLNPMIAAKLYVASSDAAMNSEIFPWPEFKFQEIFIEMIRLHINGMANDTGRAYLKQKLNSNQDV
ncbi:MAG: TetR/AcrR family transcriptional regulator [Crocinitomicaceae bacterium]|nr:TetR/AcrR family transcriptional regulator [Crocinitomicaceae bacterium]